MLVASVLGALVPLFFIVAFEMDPWPRPSSVAIPGSIGFFETPLWPSVIMLMASRGSLWTAGNMVVLALSVGVNVALYALSGAALWFGFHKRRMVLFLWATALASLWWLSY